MLRPRGGYSIIDFSNLRQHLQCWTKQDEFSTAEHASQRNIYHLKDELNLSGEKIVRYIKAH